VIQVKFINGEMEIIRYLPGVNEGFIVSEDTELNPKEA